jgi:hypothetical protein
MIDAPVVSSRMRTPLILTLNYTYAKPWSDMTPSERALTLRAILTDLGRETAAIYDEIKELEKDLT